MLRMKIYTMQQRSDEWYEVRKGKFTASDFDTLMPSSRQGENDFNQTQMKIIYRVASERITGEIIQNGFISKAMQDGIDREDEARIAYELTTGESVDQVGFIEFDEWIGCSPDGIIGESKGLEIKCPQADTFLSYLQNPQLLIDEYFWQVQGGLLCSCRGTWYIMAYHPKYPINKQLIICSVTRDEESIEKLRRRLSTAIEKVKLIIDEVME